MAIDVSKRAAQIRTAVHGLDVRDNLAGGLEDIAGDLNSYEATLSADNDDFKSDIGTRQTNLENTFNQEIANQTVTNPSNAETVAARTDNINSKTYDTIGKRLDDHSSQLADIAINIKQFSGNLQQAHDYISTNFQHGTILLSEDITITDTFTWDIAKVNIVSSGYKITANIADNTKYAVKITSSSPNPYGSPIFNKVNKSYGFQLVPVTDYMCNGINVDGTITNKVAYWALENVIITKFNVGLRLGTTCYMTKFTNGNITMCNRNVWLDVAGTDSGERITFENCDINMANNCAIYNDSNQSLTFINCSLDWNKQAFYTKGLLTFIAPHMETPADVIDPNTYYGVIDGGIVKITAARILLNYANNNVNPQSCNGLFNTVTPDSKLDIDAFMNCYGYSQLIDGTGIVCSKNIRHYNNYAPTFPISNADIFNVFSDPHINLSTTGNYYDGWAIGGDSSGQALAVATFNGKNALKMTHKYTGQKTYITSDYLNIESFKNYIFSYMSCGDTAGNLDSIKISLYNSHKQLVNTITIPGGQYANVTTSWAKAQITEFGLRNIPANIKYATITFTSFAFPNGTNLYFTDFILTELA